MFMTAIAAGQAKWQNLTMDYLVRQDESGYGVEIRETAVRSVFEHLLPPGPGNLEKTTDFAARLARGSVFADPDMSLPLAQEEYTFVRRLREGGEGQISC